MKAVLAIRLVAAVLLVLAAVLFLYLPSQLLGWPPSAVASTECMLYLFLGLGLCLNALFQIFAYHAGNEPWAWDRLCSGLLILMVAVVLTQVGDQYDRPSATGLTIAGIFFLVLAGSFSISLRRLIKLLKPPNPPRT